MRHNSIPFSRFYALLILTPALLTGLVPALVVGVAKGQVRTLPKSRTGSAEPGLPRSLAQGQTDSTFRSGLKQRMEKYNAA